MILKKTLLLLTFISAEIGALSFLIVSNSSKDSSGGSPSESTSTSQSPSKYLMHTVSFDTDGGSEIEPVTVKHGYRLSRPDDPIKSGFALISWKHDNKIWDFNANVVMDDITLKVDWDIVTYTIEYNFLGGSTESYYETSYNVESQFDLVRPTKELNVFAGWFDQNNHRVDSIVLGSTGNLVLTARWLDNLSIKSLDESRGTIYAYGDEENPYKVTLKNIPVNKKQHVFKGWYNDSDSLLSRDDEYTFVMKKDVVNYVNSKYMDDMEENKWNKDHCINPTIDEDVIRYGIYPQSVVTDDSLISILGGLNPSYFNGFIHYRGEYYAQQKARLADINGHPLDIREFDCGEEIIENKIYWFKFEPISWKIIKDYSDKYSLLSEKLLSNIKFHINGATRIIDDKTIWSNNYEYSDVRKWLNNDFYSTAFAFGNNEILTSEIDNSANSTADPTNPYVCNDTFDKVFLLSYKDYTDTEYGFAHTASSTSTRQFKTTDLSRAQGGLYGTDPSNLFCGYYWTRSPIVGDETGGYFVSRCNKNGTINYDFIGESHSMVQPAINIEI